jgi:hypothetical protein
LATAQTAGFERNQFCVERICQPRDDLILHIEQISNGLVEALGPKMGTRLSINKLYVDAKPIDATLDAAFKCVPDIEIASDLFHVDVFAFEGEGCVAGDHRRTRQAGQISG